MFSANACFRPTALLIGMSLTAGCGGTSAKVTGRVTCQGKPVAGIILFSPKGNVGAEAGAAVTAPLQEDGGYEIRLKGAGAYTVVVTPRDVVLRPKAGTFDYPCDRSPQEREIKAGDNEITIELPKRSK